MAKLTLQDIAAGFGLTTTYNDNSSLIEAAIENTLSRDGTGPNQMEANLDMNSFRIINLADGIDPQDAVTKFQLDNSLASGLPSGNLNDVLVHDGAMFVSSLTIPDAAVQVGAVTQHQSALVITESQISDLAHTTDASDLISGVLADGRVQESNVTQHQAALSITESQISDLQAYLLDITGEPIGDLSDVFNSAPADRNVLVYHAGNARYQNDTLSAADITGVVNTLGSALVGQIAIFTDLDTIAGDPQFIWNDANKRLEIFGSGLSNRMRLFHDDTDFGMTAVNGGGFNVTGLGDAFDIAIQNSVFGLTVRGDPSGAADPFVSKFINEHAGDAGDARVEVFGNRDTTPGRVVTLHEGANSLATPLTGGPTGTQGAIGTSGAATDFLLFTNDVARVFLDGTTGQFGLQNYSFPVADGGADQVLVTDGAGVLSYKDQAIAGGLLSGQYRFSTSTVAADPGSGLFRYNSATPASVTQIFVDDITSNGVDISNILALITTGDRLYIQSEADSSAFIVFDVNAPTTDNTGWFTIDGTVAASGTLHGSNVRTLFVVQLQGAAGANGDVFKVGTPVNNEIGVWTGDGTLEGDTNFQWDGGSLLLPQTNDAVTPTLSFGTGDGFYAGAAGQVHVATAGVSRGFFNSSAFSYTGKIGTSLNGSGALLNQAASASVPTVIPNQNDTNTGLGWVSADLLAFIAGGNECARATFVSGVPQFGVADGTLVRPGLSFQTDPNTGLARLVSSEVSVIAASTEIARFGALGMDTRGTDIFNGSTTSLDLDITAGTDGSGNGGTLTIRAGASGGSSTKGGSVVIEATNGAGGGAEGGDITLTCGNASGSGDDGGDFLAMGGNGTGGGGNGGTATIEAGRSVGGGIGGIAAVVGGVGGNGANTGGIGRVIGGRGGDNGGDGGDAEVTGGAGVTAGSDGDGGDVVITGGAGAGTGVDGDVILAVVGATNIVFDATTGRFEQGAETLAYLSEIATDAAVAANTAKVTNATHTGEVTGSVALAVDPTAISGKALVTAVATDMVLLWDATDSLLKRADAGDFLGAAGLDNDALQIRRTTDYTLTTAFVDVTLDTLDIETDAAVIEHAVATDDVTLHVAGTYKVDVDYEVISTAVSGDPVISVDTRVRLNDAGTGIAGSVIEPYSYRDGSVGGADGNIKKHISNSFIFTASASDKITLQLGKTEITGSATFNVSDLCIKVARLL